MLQENLLAAKEAATRIENMEEIQTMKKTLISLAVVACLMPLVGQEAKVVVVEKSDSARLAKAYKNYQDALKEWERAKTEVADHYLNEPCTVPSSYRLSESRCRRSGWENIQFSSDFRAIVPESHLQSTGTFLTRLDSLGVPDLSGTARTLPCTSCSAK
jgi:hypothetical protein